MQGPVDLDEILGPGTEPVEIAVFGMACKRCEATVETVLTDREDVESAQADRAQDSVLVEAQPDVAVEELVDAIRAVGYEARPSSASS